MSWVNDVPKIYLRRRYTNVDGTVSRGNFKVSTVIRGGENIPLAQLQLPGNQSSTPVYKIPTTHPPAPFSRIRSDDLICGSPMQHYDTVRVTADLRLRRNARMFTDSSGPPMDHPESDHGNGQDTVNTE